MTVSKNELFSSQCITGFTLPKLHKGKEWYVGFSAYDPASGKSKRKKYMLNRYKRKKDREAAASIMIHNLIELLKSGWNPFVDSGNPRKFAKIPFIIGQYRDHVKVMADKNVMKQKTAYDYLSRIKVFNEYLEEDGSVVFGYQLDGRTAVNFLDYLFYARDVSARTRNNYRGWLSSFFSWLVERKFVEENPVDGIATLPEDEKFRDALTPADLNRLRDYLGEHDRRFLLACLFEYYTFIRPDELSNVKIGDISIERQTVFVSSAVSKNRRDGLVALNDSIIRLMIELRVFDSPSHYYLFGKGLVPSEKKGGYNLFRNYWNKVRPALKFPKSYQFYSLKDSGIRDLANAQGIVAARDQARHTDIAVTNRYLKKAKEVNEETKHFKGSL